VLGIGHYLENLGLREAAMLYVPLATMAWCILRLWMAKRSSRFGG